MSLKSKAVEAIKDPREVPPYLKARATGPARRALTDLAMLGLDEQFDALQEVRGQDRYLLVVLDACRWDMYQELSAGLFDQRMQPMKSEGYDTFQYIGRCWPDEYPETTYVSGATPVASSDHAAFDDAELKEYYEGYRPPDHIGTIVDAWDDCWDPSVGTAPPEAVAKEAAQRCGEDELVCHLFQPHAPYIGEPSMLGHSNTDDAKPRTGEPVDAPLWKRVRTGDVPQSKLLEAYKGNLERTLDAVCWLLQETGREAVIIGDHGEALGELGIYSHPRKAHPKIRVVPHAKVRGLTPRGRSRAKRAARRAETNQTGDSRTAKERLEALGYI